jgi:hypothetical protein
VACRPQLEIPVEIVRDDINNDPQELAAAGKGTVPTPSFALEFFSAIDLAQIAVECAERQMTGLSSDFEKEAVSEAKRWPRPEDVECRCHMFPRLRRSFRK